MRSAHHFRRLIAPTGISFPDRYLSSVTSDRLAELGLGMERVFPGPAVFAVSGTQATRAGLTSVNSAAITPDAGRSLQIGAGQ